MQFIIALFFSLWTGINQWTRPGPPVVVDKQLAAIIACSAESLSGGCLGDYGILLVLIAPLKLNEKLDLPFSVSPSASNLPDQDSCFQEMSSLICRSEFTGTKKPWAQQQQTQLELWSPALEGKLGRSLLAWIKKRVDFSEWKRERMLVKMDHSLGLRAWSRRGRNLPFFWQETEKKQQKSRVNRGAVLCGPGKCCCWEGGGNVLLRMGT